MLQAETIICIQLSNNLQFANQKLKTNKDMTIKIKNNWDEITWKEYEQIEQILSADIPNDFKTVHLVSILTGLPVNQIENMQVTEFQKLLPHLEFLETEPETHYHNFEYTINDREYVFKGKLEDITTAMYIDYSTYMKEEDKDVVKLLSVFLIPKGHDYNDGYDMEQVQSDIGDMCWLDVRATAFFFKIQLAAYMLILKSSLQKTLKKTMKGKTRAEKKEIKKQIKELETSFNNSVSSLLS